MIPEVIYPQESPSLFLWSETCRRCSFHVVRSVSLMQNVRAAYKCPASTQRPDGAKPIKRRQVGS